MAAVARSLAVSVMPLENRREQFLTLATLGERLGYDAMLLPETWAYDVTIVLAEAAVKTERLKVGSAILGVWSRSAATLAMGAATLASLSNGRFVLGLGASTPQLVEGLHDVPFGAPLARMRQVVTQVRALLRGERVPLAVAKEARALRLNVPPAEVPICLAAIGDASVRLAGEIADGWMPFLYPVRMLGRGLERLREGAARASRATLPAVYPMIPASVDDDADAARAGAAWLVSFYLTSMGTFYRDTLIRFGFDKEVQAVLAANVPKFAAVVPPDAEVLLDELIVYGTPADARRRLARWYEAGAAMPGLMFRPNLTADETRRSLEAFVPMLESR
jgi:alkanesulfonate monooxygenase SsuD/methylene tetrahydromethanopterin reductase-like flavin-dependent oxidoreductase (luciferase family)